MKDISRIFTISFVLGSIFTVCLLLFKYNVIFIWLAFLSFFHAVEFYFSAIFRPEKVTSEAFLLDNSLEYSEFLLANFLEHTIKTCFYNNYTTRFPFFAILLTLTGLFMRLLAIAQLGQFFNHSLDPNTHKKIITDGIFRYKILDVIFQKIYSPPFVSRLFYLDNWNEPYFVQ